MNASRRLSPRSLSIVLAAADPVFAAPGAWPQEIAPDFRNDFARVYLLKP